MVCNKSTCILHLAGYGRHVTVLSCGLLSGVWQSNLMTFGFSCPDYTWMTSLHFDRLWQELVEVLDINVVCFQLDLASLLFESIWGLSYFMSPSERENFHQNSERYKYYCEMMFPTSSAQGSGFNFCGAIDNIRVPLWVSG